MLSQTRRTCPTLSLKNAGAASLANSTVAYGTINADADRHPCASIAQTLRAEFNRIQIPIYHTNVNKGIYVFASLPFTPTEFFRQSVASHLHHFRE